MLATQQWDSPVAQALNPKEWQWYGPDYALLVEMRDILRQINYKTPLQKQSDRQRMPRMTTPPWAKNEHETKFTPEPVTQEDIDAHLERLNGRRD